MKVQRNIKSYCRWQKRNPDSAWAEFYVRDGISWHLTLWRLRMGIAWTR